MAHIIMVAGGSRSGKSAVAEARLEGCQRIAYVATMEIVDDEVRGRVEEHRRRRPESWQTIEAQHDLAAGVVGADPRTDAILVDCLTCFLSNRLLALTGSHTGEADPSVAPTAPEALARTDVTPVLQEVDRFLLAAAKHPAGKVVVVTNETGCGLIPPSVLGRAFRDLQGWANQRLAAAADEVILVQFGIETRLK